jgi:hypothetical protein
MYSASSPGAFTCAIVSPRVCACARSTRLLRGASHPNQVRPSRCVPRPSLGRRCASSLATTSTRSRSNYHFDSNLTWRRKIDDVYCPVCRLVFQRRGVGQVAPSHCPRCAARRRRRVPLLALDQLPPTDLQPPLADPRLDCADSVATARTATQVLVPAIRLMMTSRLPAACRGR